MTDTFLEHVGRHAKKRRTYVFYSDKTKQLLRFEPWKTLRLNQIDAEQIDKYTAWRVRSVSATTVNHDLKTLRKALRLAEEWGLIRKCPKVRMLPATKGRDFVISPELEADYLSVAPYPLREAVTLMLDFGLRPEECVVLRKSDIGSETIRVTQGKTINAARSLPLTARTLHIIQLCSALFPDSPFLFPGRKGHYTRKALDNAHRSLCKKYGFSDKFVLHSCRHTFASRLAESGADLVTIKDLLGHADVRMANKYVHLSQNHLVLAMKRKEQYDKILRGENSFSLEQSDLCKTDRS